MQRYANMHACTTQTEPGQQGCFLFQVLTPSDQMVSALLMGFNLSCISWKAKCLVCIIINMMTLPHPSFHPGKWKHRESEREGAEAERQLRGTIIFKWLYGSISFSSDLKLKSHRIFSTEYLCIEITSLMFLPLNLSL